MILVGKEEMPDGTQRQYGKPKTAEEIEGDRLVALTEQLQSIDSGKSLAKLNETTITDNNGGRIDL